MTVIECIDPQQVNDSDYMAYLDGAKRSGFAQHLPACQYCQAEIAAFKVADAAISAQLHLTKAVNRASCPDTLVIGNYVLARLKPKARKELETHLATCKYCLQELAQFNMWAAETQTETTKRNTGNVPVKPTDVKQWLGRVVATMLTITPATPPMSQGLRGDAPKLPIAYTAEGIVVNVVVQKAGFNRVDLQVMGEVFVEDESMPLTLEGTEIRLLHAEETLATEVIDENGNFFFDGVKSVDFNMEIQLFDRIVAIPDLHKSSD